MLQQMDLSVLLWIQDHLRTDFLNGFWKAITFLGNGGWFWIVLGIALVLFRKTRPVGITVLAALAIGALITNVCLKNWVARVRPYDYSVLIHALVGPEKDFSFPSGHTCSSFAAAFVCWKMLPRQYGAAAMILAALITFSRLYVGVHYPTDVLGGLMIGIVSAIAACHLTGKAASLKNK